MPDFALLESGPIMLKPGEAELAEAGWEDFEKALKRHEGGEALLAEVMGSERAKSFITSVFGNSPYLKRLMVREPLAALSFLKASPQASFDAIRQDLKASFDEPLDQNAAKTALRKAKAKAALLIALADLGGAWALDDVTRSLSVFADLCLDLCLRFQLRERIRAGQVELEDDGKPERSCGIAVIAMGKYGAFELNYSSDIDVVVFFDPERVPVPEGEDPQKLAIRLTKGIVNLMQDRTGDGYVFRTDLRLRPDASATAVALSVHAASFYYETMGQNWERAAWIKARACAGDRRVGEEFLEQQKPYIWRRYLDYAAIEDIHSIKRQIHATKGHAEIAFEGHNIKLGRGGIREIEFFAQTQQLIGGGRDPSLRSPTTEGALEALTAAGIVKPEVRDDLVKAYYFLREVEHRLQMVNDEQTHSMPKTAEGVDAIAGFAGFEDPKLFRETLRQHLQKVQNHYAELFEEEPSLGAAHGNLVFTGVEDDPGTLETLTDMGFAQASRAAAIVRTWHHGRIRVMRSERARALLTKLVPHLLEAFSRTEDPDAAMVNFDQFLTGLPSGVQLFSMLLSHPELIVLLADILGSAPRLSRSLASNSGVLDVLLDPDFYHALPSAEELKAEFAEALKGAGYFEEVLDAARIWASEMRFRAGVNVLTGHMEAGQLGPFFADFADAIIEGLIPFVEQEIIEKSGPIKGEFAVIALGKLGGKEMSATSDLDIIFVYETEDPEAMSEGPRPLHNTQYFARLSQRLISALTAPTSEGQMFEIDTRLRPSGNSGPIAIRFQGFDRYQREEAWTWEQMALTRARVLGAASDLADKIKETIRDVLCAKRDAEKIYADVSEMRARIFKEFGSENPWNLKHVRGGLVDVEFMAQTLQLLHAHDNPKVLAPNTLAALRQLKEEGALAADVADDLMAACQLLHNLTQLTRVCIDGELNPETISQNLRTLIAKAGGEETFEAVEEKLIASEAKVRHHFETLIEAHAARQEE